nr:acyl--CoA ligase [Bryobacter sp.]
MRRETLIDVFDDLARLEAPFVSYDDGYRSWDFTYRKLAAQARAVAMVLRERGIAKGDKVLLWGENRPGWVAALWGCLLEGVVAVPIDYRSTAQFLERVHGVVKAKLLFAGEEVTPPAMAVMRLKEVEALAGVEALPGRVEIHREDVAEILFTSGATAEPKGVLITHKNLMANLGPVEGEVRKYRAHPAVKHFAQYLFFPIRFLNLLPLSHLFGQSMATFIPPTIDGQVLFLKGHNPHEIVRQIERRRVSVLVCVPKILEVLRDYVIRHAPEAAQPMPVQPAGKFGFLKRWRHYRRVHRLLGWKFWAFVVGAAPLDPELEEFWKRMGYVVIQGYGLTETAPIVSLNHP